MEPVEMTLTRDPSWHGTANDAIEFALYHNDATETFEFLQAWSVGDLREWPEFYHWLVTKPNRAEPILNIAEGADCPNFDCGDDPPCNGMPTCERHGHMATIKSLREELSKRPTFAADRIEALEGALEFYADRDYDGYDVNITDFGLSTEEGHIIQDRGERARAALSELAENDAYILDHENAALKARGIE